MAMNLLEDGWKIVWKPFLQIVLSAKKMLPSTNQPTNKQTKCYVKSWQYPPRSVKRVLILWLLRVRSWQLIFLGCLKCTAELFDLFPHKWAYCCVCIVVYILLCIYCCVHIVVYVLLCAYCCVRLHRTQNPQDVNPVVLGPKIEGVGICNNSENPCKGARTRTTLTTSTFLCVLSSHRIPTSSLVLRGMKFVIVPLLRSALSVCLTAMYLFYVTSQQTIRQLLNSVTAFNGKCGNFLLLFLLIYTLQWNNYLLNNGKLENMPLNRLLHFKLLYNAEEHFLYDNGNVVGTRLLESHVTCAGSELVPGP